MAVTVSDTFAIPIEINDNVSKRIDKIISNLNSAIKKIPKDVNFDPLKSQLKKVSSSLSRVNKNVDKATESFIKTASSVQNASDNLLLYNDVIDDTSRRIKLNRSITDRLVSSFIKYAKIIDSVSTVTDSFGISLRRVLNPKFLNRLENLLSILAAIAKFKGLDTFAKALLSAKDKVESLELSITNLAQNGENDFENLAEAADAYNSKLGGVALAALKFKNQFSKTFGSFSQIFLSSFTAFNNFSDTIADLTVVVRGFFDSFNSFTDPAFFEKISKVTSILSTILRFKGQNEMADMLGLISDKAGGLSETLATMQTEGAFDLNKLFEKTQLLDRAMTAFQVAVTSSKSALVGFFALKFAQRFEVFNKTIAKLDLGFKNLMGKTQIFGSFLNSRFNIGLLKFTELATILSPLLFGIGQALSGSEDAFVSFLGKVTLATSLLAGAFASAITLAIKLISDFSISLGDNIIKMMERFGQISAKSESVISAFNFTIRGFNRVVGESVGSLEFWEDQIFKIMQASTFTTNEIRKGISLLVKEGAALGLDAQKNAKIALIAADVAAATGKEFEDTSRRIIEGLAGQSQGLLALGINVRESHLEHSEFIVQLGKTVGELSEAEKKTLRFNEIIKQTAPLVGAAAEAINTVEGATKVYSRTLEEVQIRIGEADYFTKIYLNTLTKLNTIFLLLPDAVITVVGTFLDFSGVTLKIVGTLIKYTLVIGLIGTAFAALNLLLKTNITLQSAMSLVLGLTAKQLGVQVIAVTSLNRVFLQLALITKGVLLKSLSMLSATLLNIGKTIAVVTAQILINPLFLKAALIVTAIAAVVKAISELAEEFKWLTVNMDASIPVFGFFEKVLSSVTQIAAKLFGSLVSISKILISGLVGGFLLASRALKSWQFIMADGKEERNKIQKDIDEIDAKLQKVNKTLKQSAQTLTDVTGNTSAAASSLKEQLDLEKFSQNQAKNLLTINDAIKNIDKEAIRIATVGNEFEKVNLTVQQSEKSFKNLFEQLKNGSEVSEESLENLKTAYQSFAQAGFERDALRMDTFKQIGENIQNIELSLLKSSGQEIRSIRAVAQIRDEEFEKRVQQIRSAFTLTMEEENKIANLRRAMARKTENEITAIRKKAEDERLKKAQQIAEKQMSFVVGLQQETAQSEIDALKSQGDLIAAQERVNARNLQVFDQKIQKYVEQQKLLNQNFELEQKTLEVIEAQRNAIESKNAASLKEAAKEERKANQAAISDSGPQLFGEQQVQLIDKAFGSAAGQLAGAASSFMSPVTAMMGAAQVVVGAIQALIDFVPQIINAVANIFNSLTELPLKIAEATSGLIDSMGNLIANLIPNIIKGFTKNIQTIVRYLAEVMPTAFAELPVLMIDALLGLVDQLPTLMENITKAFFRIFITAPTLFVTGLIKMLPKLIVALIQAIPLVIEAFVLGIVDGLKEAVNAISGMLGFGDIFDMPEIKEQINKLGEEIQRATSQIFKVLDLEAAGRGLDVADRIRNAITSASSSGANFFEKSWKKLKKWFEEKFGPVFAKGWQALKTFFENMGSAFYEFGVKIWEGLQSQLGKMSEMAKGFGDNVSVAAKGFGDNIANAAKGFGDNISLAAKGFGDNVSVAAKGFGDNISNAAKGLGRNISDQFQGAVDNLKNFKLPKFDIPDISDFKLPRFEIPNIPTPGWIQTFKDAVKSLTSWSLPFSSGGLVGKVQNSAPSPGGYTGQVIDKVTSFFSEGGPVSQGASIPKGTTQNGVLYAQTGAFASQGTDTIPAMLTPGEFVVNREGTRNNLGLLSFINKNKDSVSPAAPQNSTINVTINAKTSLDINTIRREIVPELERQLRRKSQEGKSVINAAGIRA